MKLSEAFASDLVAWRKSRRLTQQELGDKMGYHAQFISNCERGVQPPSPAFIKRFCKVTGAPLATMLDKMAGVYREQLEAKVKAAK